MPKNPKKTKETKPRPLRQALGHFAARTDKLEDGLFAWLYRFRIVIFLVAVTALAVWGRVSLWPMVSADYAEHLFKWLADIREANGFHSIGQQIGNYTPAYHYLMAAMTYIPGLSSLEVIKITSTAGDFCMAAAAAFLAWQLCHEKWKAAITYALVLALPTVVLNSAAWGQCDAMYTTFILLFLGFLLAKRPTPALIMFGVSLAIKLQAIFVLPAVLILWLCRRLRLRHLLAGCAAYVLVFLPAMITDGGFAPLFRAYSMQASVVSLSSNIQNLPALLTGFDEYDLTMLSPALMAIFALVCGAVALYCWQKKDAFSAQSEFLLVLLFALLAPFLLPSMRDRYYYVAEVLCVLYALYFSRRSFAPLLMQLGSLPAYMYYLRGVENPFGRWLVPVIGTVIVFVFIDLRTRLSAPQPSPAASLGFGSTPPAQ